MSKKQNARKQKKAKARQDRIKKSKNLSISLPIKATTPRVISDRIKGFCKKATGNEPFYVDVNPLGVKSKCYFNCLVSIKDIIEEKDAEIVWGWLVWEGAHMLELEHHSVLKLGDDYMDPTPTVDGEKKILFVPNDIPPFLKAVRIPEVKDSVLTLGISYNNLIYPNSEVSMKHIASGFPCKGGVDLDEIYLKSIEGHFLENNIKAIREKLVPESFKSMSSISEIVSLVKSKTLEGNT